MAAAAGAVKLRRGLYLTPRNGGGHTAPVRIIAGRFRGQGIAAPRGLATRPTADRVREALFSILGDVEGLDVLDLFAGSGALGLEALSRGARAATFVDAGRAAVAAIRANVATLGVGDETTVIAADVGAGIRRLAGAGASFGLVFCDPPYARTETGSMLESLVARGLLAPGAWIVLEHAARADAPGPGDTPSLEARFTRTYGDTALTFYRWSTSEAK